MEHTITQPLTAEQLAKTEHGIIPTFAHVFKGARYARRLYSDRQRGTAHDERPGEMYLGTEYRDRDILPDSVPMKDRSILVCTPVIKLPRFSPRIASRSMGSVGPSGLKLIAWRPAGHFLVLALDPNHIHDVWLGFVPITERFEVAP